MISVVIASRNDTLLNSVTQSIKNTIGVKHEIIVVKDILGNKGICKVYNEGACKAIYHYLCFVHEDIIFHTNNWGEKLIKHFEDTSIALIGVLGNTVKTLAPSGAFMFNSNLIRINHLQRTKNGETEFYCQNPDEELTSEVKVLDGMFLATTKQEVLKYPFDEHLLTGFHGYDIDFSIGQSKNGRLMVIYDILLEHLSFGNFNVEWINAQLNVTKKWKHYLPLHNGVSKTNLKAAEVKNIKQFLIFLYAYNYRKRTQLYYFLKLIILRPFSFSNFYFLRKLIIYGKLEAFLKKIKSAFILENPIHTS